MNAGRVRIGRRFEPSIEANALSREIVGLSTQHRVLSPKTSLLVLETE